MPSFSIAIALSVRPKSFREAIAVARRLNIRYLWIYFLCIMQDWDDLADCYRKASMMDQVYMQAICKISATDARDGTGGLFRHRPLHHIHPAHVDLCTKGVGYHRDSVHCTVLYSDLLRHNITRSAVGQRRWILQERLLARRILHFSSHQLFWECREHQACERYLSGFPPHSDQDHFKAIHEYSPSGEPSLATPVSISGRDHWTELVQLYTSMSLTDINDRLIALSGIAKARAAKFGDAYVAGMWRQDLAHQLLWHTRNYRAYYDENIKTRPPVYRAPSWSWASIEQPVFNDSRSVNDRLLYHVEDVSLTHATEDTTGRMLGGWLQLRAILRPTRIGWCRIPHDERQTCQWDLWGLVVGDDSGHRLRAGIIFDVPPASRTSYDEDNAQNRLFYIPTMEREPSSSLLVCGLLLRVVDLNDGTFERLGSLSDEGRDDLPLVLPDFEEDVKKNLPCVRYEDGLHIIRII